MAKTLLIVANTMHAADVQRQLDPQRKDFIVSAPGAMHAGQRWDKILITREAYLVINNPAMTSPAEADRNLEWYRDVVLTRVKPGHMVIHI